MPHHASARKDHYRVAIIGGGPAGSACALALAQRGVTDTLLIESGEYDQFRIGESIPPESRRFFQALGIYQDFLAEDHLPCYGSCSYWGSDKRGYNDSLLNPLGHGWHLDRRKFNRFLAHKAGQAGVELLTDTSLAASEELAGSGFLLHIGRTGSSTQANTSASIHADYVIDATGSRGLFARQRGSKKIGADPLVCLAARYAIQDHDQAVSKLTHLEAVEHGWWYAARLPDDTLLLTFSSDADTVKTMGLHKPDNWLALLDAASNTKVLTRGTVQLDAGIHRFPAPSYCLDRPCGDKWLAIGDAASAYDPITSQGIIKSLANALLAGHTTGQWMTGDTLDPGRFAQTIAAEYQQYLAMRRYFYQLERRWPDSIFWRRYQA